MPECNFETISPQMAKEWLDSNHRNRVLSVATVDRIAAAILRGEWMSDATDAIALDIDGGVVNGRHRLSGIIKADTAVEMLVVRGVRPEVIKVIDQGRSRSFTQWLALDGRYGQPTTLAGSVTWLYRMIGGHEARMPEAFKPTTPQLLDILDEHKNVEMSIDMAQPVHARLGLQHGWLTAYHYAMASADSERADDFFGQLASGEGVKDGDPVYVLRERYVANMTAPESKKASTTELIAWLVKAWNAAAADQKINSKQLVFRKSGKFAEVFPKVGGLPWLAGDEQLVS